MSGWTFHPLLTYNNHFIWRFHYYRRMLRTIYYHFLKPMSCIHCVYWWQSRPEHHLLRDIRIGYIRRDVWCHVGWDILCNIFLDVRQGHVYRHVYRYVLLFRAMHVIGWSGCSKLLSSNILWYFIVLIVYGIILRRIDYTLRVTIYANVGHRFVTDFFRTWRFQNSLFYL